MLNSIYAMNLSSVVLLMFIFVVGWGCAAALTKKKELWRGVNFILAVLALLVIIYMTLLNREPGERQLNLIPFASLVNRNPEVIRAMTMNIFLFFPFGLTFSSSLTKRLPAAVRIVITVAIGFFLSLSVEFLQYRYALGVAETDDVLCNTLGAFIGGLTVIISEKLS